MAAVFISIAVALPVVGGVVLLVRRLLQRHEFTDQHFKRLERDRAPVDVMQLPTLTTEGTARVARHPKIDIDANIVRMRGQGF